MVCPAPTTLSVRLADLREEVKVETLGIEAIDNDNRCAVMVPAGETITELSGPRPDKKRLLLLMSCRAIRSWGCSTRMFKSEAGPVKGNPA
jgi:hypothetical protein